MRGRGLFDVHLYDDPDDNSGNDRGAAEAPTPSDLAKSDHRRHAFPGIGGDGAAAKTGGP